MFFIFVNVLFKLFFRISVKKNYLLDEILSRRFLSDLIFDTFFILFRLERMFYHSFLFKTFILIIWKRFRTFPDVSKYK